MQPPGHCRILLQLSTAGGRGVSPLQTQLSPPKTQQNSTATDVTIYEYQSMKKCSLHPSCVRQGLWGLGCLPQPRLQHPPPLPMPGQQPGPAAPSCCFRQRVPAWREDSAMQPPSSLCQHFSDLTAGSSTGGLILLSHPTSPSSSGSGRLHISSSDLSPFHTTQIKPKSNP